MKRFFTRPVTLPMWGLALGAIVLLALGGAGGSTDDTTDVATSDTTTTTGVSAGADLTETTESTTTTVATTTTSAPTTTTTTQPEQPREVARFSGSSDKTTPSFVVKGQWDLAWAITGGAGVGISVFTEGGEKLQYLSTDPGEERTIMRRSCTCYLEFSTFGSSYTVVVTDIPG